MIPVLQPAAALLTVGLFALPLAEAAAQLSPRVVTAAVAGMTCHQGINPYGGPRLDCDYQVGQSLQFAVVGVGQSDVTFTIFKADWDGDYYVSLAALHGCIVINEGKTTADSLRTNGVFDRSYAFVSLKNGKVYADWPSCQRAA